MRVGPLDRLLLPAPGVLTAVMTHSCARQFRSRFRSPALLSLAVLVLLGAGLSPPWHAVGHDRDDRPAADDVSSRRITVMSFNIRFGTAGDGANHWDHRREACIDVINRHGGDFIGLQEAMRFQIDAIREACADYGELGIGRDDGARSGEHCTILYNTTRWRLDDDHRGTFWLSDTPDAAGSRSWGNTIPRIVTWGRFVERSTDRAVWVFNTHFDHRSQPSRERSAVLLAARVAQRARPDEPAVVTGDFNAGEGNPAMRYLVGDGAIDGSRSPHRLIDTFRAVEPDAADVGTFTGFAVGETGGEKIDAVLVTPGLDVLGAAIVRETYVDANGGARYPSDHFPVHSVLSWPAPTEGE